MFNFTDQTRSGVFNMAWPMSNLDRISIINWLIACHIFLIRKYNRRLMWWIGWKKNTDWWIMGNYWKIPIFFNLNLLENNSLIHLFCISVSKSWGEKFRPPSHSWNPLYNCRQSNKNCYYSRNNFNGNFQLMTHLSFRSQFLTNSFFLLKDQVTCHNNVSW